MKVVHVHENLNSLAFSASGKQVFVWKLEEGDLIKVLEDHERPVSTICCYQFSDTVSNDKYPASVVTGGDDSFVMVYAMNGFALKHKLDNKAGPIYDVSIPVLPYGERKERLPVIVVACFNGSVQLWSLGEGEWLSSIHYPEGGVRAMCILPTPNPGLVSGHSDGTVLLTNLTTREVLAPLTKNNAEILPHRGPTCAPRNGHSVGIASPVTTLSYSMFPRPMVLGGFQDSRVYIWDLSVGDSDEATLLRYALTLDLEWRDPTLAHDTDSDDDDNQAKENYGKESI